MPILTNTSMQVTLNNIPSKFYEPPKKALILVALFVLKYGSIIKSTQDNYEITQDIFEGFSVSNDIWNETPFQSIAVRRFQPINCS